MVIVETTFTYKSCSPYDRWTRHPTNIHKFRSLQDAKEWVQEEYKDYKTVKPLYMDTLEKEAVKVGSIYCGKFIEDGKTYYAQYWVTFYEKNILPQ